MNQSMNTQDAVSANYAECFVTIDGTRYSMLMAKEFEGKATINTKEVYKLGNPVVGHKAQTMALAFSMTIYKCTEIFDTVVERFLKTGVMPTFTVQTSNDDPATSVGQHQDLQRLYPRRRRAAFYVQFRGRFCRTVH